VSIVYANARCLGGVLHQATQKFVVGDRASHCVAVEVREMQAEHRTVFQRVADALTRGQAARNDHTQGNRHTHRPMSVASPSVPHHPTTISTTQQPEPRARAPRDICPELVLEVPRLEQRAI
jgi:hypothetical protein